MATNVDISDSKLWPDFVTKAFIDIMVDEVTKGKMPNETNTVTASEEVWRNYLKVHDKASQFQKKGCDHYKLLEIIFNKNNATGVLHHSSTQDPPNTYEENELDNQYLNNGSASHVCVNGDSSDDDLHEVEHITRSGKIQVQLRGIGIGVWRLLQGVTSDCSLTKCVTVLDEMEDIPHDAYGKALEKFMNPDWREVFIAMSVERKRGWVLRL
ncbi:hypothetical protein KIW84_033503 [Lathyrus oleraceus]|uniref:Uncharacterized protein n=1 Tax=Pisum sativum TaxID=3888 RepID=A0A9D4XYQ8_PEA|nr:hypothetical protein KIW84_033503 [Pisum sativum]